VALEGLLFFTAARPALHFIFSFVCDTRVPSVYYRIFFLPCCAHSHPECHCYSSSSIPCALLPRPHVHPHPPPQPQLTHAAFPHPFPVDGAVPTVAVVPVFGVSPSDHRHFHYFGNRRVLETVKSRASLRLPPRVGYPPHGVFSSKRPHR
jgi:hypothetical protein